MSHDHHGDHDHPPAHGRDHESGLPSEHELLSRAMQELLEEKGVVTAGQIRDRMEKFDKEFPDRGARVIAHAWADPEFKKRLLADGKAACAEFGIDLEADRLIAVENTPQVHNVVVCTSAPATRARSSACRPPGTRARTIASAWSAIRAAC
jgi:nitrile hydratase